MLFSSCRRVDNAFLTDVSSLYRVANLSDCSLRESTIALV